MRLILEVLQYISIFNTFAKTWMKGPYFSARLISKAANGLAMKPRHQQPCYWPSPPGLFLFQHQKGYLYVTLLLDKMAATLADDNFKCSLCNENDRIPIRFSLKCVPKSPIGQLPIGARCKWQSVFVAGTEHQNICVHSSVFIFKLNSNTQSATPCSHSIFYLSICLYVHYHH